MKLSITLVTTVLAVLLGSTSQAAILAAWEFDGVDLNDVGASGIDGNSTSSPFTFTATTSTTNIQSATLALSSAVTPSQSNNSYGFRIPTAQTDLAGAITEGHYLQFSLVASSGFLINLDSLDFLGESTSTGADSVAVLSSVTGFNDMAAIASVNNIAGNTGGFDTDSSGFGRPIDVSSAAFQGLQSVDFRIYGFNTTGSTGRTAFRSLSGDDLIINGSLIAVPEPSVFGIFALFCIFGLLFHRRLRHV